MQSSGRSRRTCLLVFKRRGWKGGKEEEMGQEMHKHFAFRQSKSTLCSLLLRAQAGWEKESGLPPALLSQGEEGMERSKAPTDPQVAEVSCPLMASRPFAVVSDPLSRAA